MEINVTAIIKETQDNPTRFSASINETRLQNISQITWRNAVEQDAFKLAPEQDEAWREYVPEYGAWDDEEIAAWDLDESTALFVQFVSGDYRELENLASGAGYDVDNLTEDQFSEITEKSGGRLFPTEDGEWFYYVGF
jgi:hypothetical protein